MPPCRICVLVITTSLLQTLLLAQNPGEQCSKKFTKGKEDFVLDADESVKDGAQILASPQLTSAEECVSACCKLSDCNLALMENGAEESTIKTCFLFNCLYKQRKVCHFVRKKGFSNYLLTSDFESYLEKYDPGKCEEKCGALFVGFFVEEKKCHNSCGRLSLYTAAFDIGDLQKCLVLIMPSFIKMANMTI